MGNSDQREREPSAEKVKHGLHPDFRHTIELPKSEAPGPAESPGSTVQSQHARIKQVLINPDSIMRATISARDETRSFAKTWRRCVQTVHELISNTAAIALFG